MAGVKLSQHDYDNLMSRINEIRAENRKYKAFHSFQLTRLTHEPHERVSFRLADVLFFQAGIGEKNGDPIDYVEVTVQANRGLEVFYLDVSYSYFHELITSY